MTTLCVFRTFSGGMLFSLAYAPETRCWFLWVGTRCYSFPARESPGVGFTKWGW